MKIFIFSLLILSIVGCVSTKPPSAIVRAPANDISLAEVNNDKQQKFLNSNVRWGGRVLKAVEVSTDKGKRLNVEILELPLDAKGRPTTTETSSGRFIAQLLPPYKKSRYYRNRHVTVTGELISYEEYPLANGKTHKLVVIDTRDRFAWQSNNNNYYSDPFYRSGFGFGHHSIFFFGNHHFYKHKYRSSRFKHRH